MKIEKQVLTIEQMQHLKDLGVEVKDTAMCWVRVNDERSIVMPYSLYTESSSAIPALNLQEILEMLPTDFLHYNEDDTEVIYGKNAQMIGFSFERFRSDNNLNVLDCAYQALCWVAENGYLNKE